MVRSPPFSPTLLPYPRHPHTHNKHAPLSSWSRNYMATAHRRASCAGRASSYDKDVSLKLLGGTQVTQMNSTAVHTAMSSQDPLCVRVRLNGHPKFEFESFPERSPPPPTYVIYR